MSRAGRRVTRQVVELTAMPWWCSPSGVTVGFLMPAICLIAVSGDLPSAALSIRGVRFLDTSFILLGLLMLTPIALGGWVGSAVQLARPKVPGEVNVQSWDFAATCLALVALFGYVIWFKGFLLNPLLLWQTLTGAWKPSRDEIGLTVGLSSLANMACVFFGFYAYRLADGHTRRMPRRMHVLMGILLPLTIFRVYVWSERLSLIETIVPFALTAGRVLYTRREKVWRWMRYLGPYAALPVVLLYFGMSEYARSWSSPTYQGKTSFWEFVIGRFVSYYYTALNNGAGVVATTPEATWHAEHILEWAHRAPFGLGNFFSEYVGYSAQAKSSFNWFLRIYEDVEFNSNSGIYTPIADLGLHGALVYMLLIGIVSGACFRAYRSGVLFGVLLFPMFFITFLEIFRYPYLGAPRAFTWALGIALALAIVSFIPQNRRPVKPASAAPRAGRLPRRPDAGFSAVSVNQEP
jgi:hypothetical protein